MTRHRVRHLLVIKDGTLVGLVSIGDVVNHCLDELGFDSGVLRDTHFATH
jgi:CBS domain-containing protein